MLTRRRMAYVGTCLLLLVATTQCTKTKSKSAGAKFTVLPTKPIVIIGDSTDANGNSIKGPWFNFRVNMTNGTTDQVTIVSLQVTLFEEDASGNQTTTVLSKSPSDFNFTTTDSTQCNFFSFGTWTVGQTQTLILDNGISECKGEPVFYIGSNTTGASGTNYSYRVTVRPLGWFGTYDLPTDRFDTQFTFYTQ